MRKLGCILFLVCILSACSDEINYAPVTDITTIERIPKNGIYHVSSGETLYSIAWRYGLDYRYLANLNHIPPPYHIITGQRIVLSERSIHPHKIKSTENITPISSRSKSHPVSQPVYQERDFNKPVRFWHWPARGTIINTYSGLNKGINIGGEKGSPVYAAAPGQVVYSGDGLRGYGNLIIIKHNSTYLSAYAHNQVVLVREGQEVKAGQEIAEMGDTGTRQTMLHFEIRREGQPVNPLNYLSGHY